MRVQFPQGSLALNERVFYLNMSRLTDALDSHFEDNDDVMNVAEHGCSGGVNGFIYNNEIRTFFFKYEDEIEQILDDEGLSYDDLINNNKENVYLQEYIQGAVWYVVERYCQEQANIIEEAA